MYSWTEKLLDFTSYQVKMFFNVDLKCHLSVSLIEKVICNTQECLRAFSLNSKEKQTDGEYGIRPFYSTEYTVFLYWLSRELYLINDIEMATWIYYLNKSLHSVELFYEVKLPAIWYCEHPLGTVMGKAQYGDYFFFYQGCTVGGNFDHNGNLNYPVIGEHVKMLSNSKIIGKSHIGNNVIVSANSYIKDSEVPDNVIVFGSSPNLNFKPNHFIGDGLVRNVLSK